MNSQGTKEGLNVREVFPLLRYALFPSRSEFGIFSFVRKLKMQTKKSLKSSKFCLMKAGVTHNSLEPKWVKEPQPFPISVGSTYLPHLFSGGYQFGPP